MQDFSSTTQTTLQRLNDHFTFTALESTKKRQVVIVSSPRSQRKQPILRSRLVFPSRHVQMLGRIAAFGVRGSTLGRPRPNLFRQSRLRAGHGASGLCLQTTTRKRFAGCRRLQREAKSGELRVDLVVTYHWLGDTSAAKAANKEAHRLKPDDTR